MRLGPITTKSGSSTPSQGTVQSQNPVHLQLQQSQDTVQSQDPVHLQQSQDPVHLVAY